MKLASVRYSQDSDRWYSTEYIPSNSRNILVYSPEFGTSIGCYSDESFKDLFRIREEVNIIYWREMPRYVPS